MSFGVGKLWKGEERWGFMLLHAHCFGLRIGFVVEWWIHGRLV